MTLADLLRDTDRISGWDWSRCRTKSGPKRWSYTALLEEVVGSSSVALDIGTGGGEVFSAVARSGDVAFDIDRDRLSVARRNLSCSIVAADAQRLPFRDASFDALTARHVGADPAEVLRVLQPGGIFLTQQVGGRTCQSVFDAFGWGSNAEFWRKEALKTGEPHADMQSMAAFFSGAGCEIVRHEDIEVPYAFLDAESMAFWLLNAPLPERVDADRHADVLAGLPLETSWHSELLVVRR